MPSYEEVIHEKKELTDKKKAHLEHMRACQNNKTIERHDAQAKEQKILTTLLEHEVGSKIEKNISKRMENKIKRDILTKLRAQKIKELKTKYNYISDDEEDPDNSCNSTDEISEESEPVIRKKSHKTQQPIKTIKQIKQKVFVPVHDQPAQKYGILELMRQSGF